MPAVRKTASVAPSTVTRLSTGEVKPRRRRTCPPGSLPSVIDNTCVRVDPRIMALLRRQGTDFRFVEVHSPTEVVVRNRPVR